MIDPVKLVASARRAWGPASDQLWGAIAPTPANRLGPLDGGESFELTDGTLEVLATPGHARHHLAFLDTGLSAVFTGDALGVRLAGRRRARPAVPPPDLDLEQMFASLDRIRSVEPKRLLRTHFGPSEAPDADIGAYRDAVEEWRDVALGAARVDPAVEYVARALREHEDAVAPGRGSPVGLRRPRVARLGVRPRRPRPPSVLPGSRTSPGVSGRGRASARPPGAPLRGAVRRYGSSTRSTGTTSARSSR